MDQMEENKIIFFFLSSQVTPRTEAPVSSVSNSLENALHTSAHSTEESLPKRTVGKHSKGESVCARAPRGRGAPGCGRQIFVMLFG